MDRLDRPTRAPIGRDESSEIAATLRDDRAADRDDRADERDAASTSRDRSAELRDQQATQRVGHARPLQRRLTTLLLQARKELRRFPPGDRTTIEDILSEALDELHHWRDDRAAGASDRIAAAGDRSAAAGDRSASTHNRADSARDRDQAAIERQLRSLPDTNH